MAKNLSTSKKKQEELLETLGDFTSKENWDKFFAIRGAGDSFEWYADWPSLKAPVGNHLSSAAEIAGSPAETLRILVPGCGSSRLSEYVYDLGFRNVTNIDFSKVAVSDMLRRYVRSRPEMKWRVMDMTEMQGFEFPPSVWKLLGVSSAGSLTNGIRANPTFPVVNEGRFGDAGILG